MSSINSVPSDSRSSTFERLNKWEYLCEYSFRDSSPGTCETISCESSRNGFDLGPGSILIVDPFPEWPFSTPAMAPHKAPATTPAISVREQLDPAREVPSEADVGRRHRGHDKLALRTDVEHARAERERDAESGADQRSGPLQGRGDRLPLPTEPTRSAW